MSSSRQLAAIMFTDIVGYTAMMGEDEQKAFSILKQNREIQKPLIEKFSGRWIKEMGDGVLAIFPTVTDAVNCAIAIQKTSLRNDFKLRIGIHLGEIVYDHNDVFGDGVNISSRLQALAPIGGIWISEPVYDNVSNKKEFKTEFIGERNLRNVKDPVKIYEILVEEDSAPELYLQKKSKSEALNDNKEVLFTKSIAVLPFVNMSNDPEQEYFCDGISEEIINALAQLDNIRVVARTSAFAFKGKNLDVREIGRALNVQTLLEGSVRKADHRLRIVTKLVSVSDGSNLWSNRYDRVLSDIFTIQENIAENVATSLQGVLTNKQKEAIRRPETIIEAYEYFLKGRQFFHQINLKEARLMFEKAIELDSSYAPAYAGLADTHSWFYEWEGSHDEDLEAAIRNSQKALDLAPQSSESHSSYGFVLSLGKRYDEAEHEFEEAIRINPSSFDAYYYYGRLCFARGQIEKSAEMFRKASEARPEDFQSLLLMGQSLRVLGKENFIDAVKEGVRRAKMQLELNPTDRRVLSLAGSNLVFLGEKEEAFKWINKALELYPDDTGVLINAACLYAQEGNKEKSLDLLEIVFGKGFGKRDWIENDPDYNNIRNEPRFKALLEKLK